MATLAPARIYVATMRHSQLRVLPTNATFQITILDDSTL
jgi:hypothetical protein